MKPLFMPFCFLLLLVSRLDAADALVLSVADSEAGKPELVLRSDTTFGPGKDFGFEPGAELKLEKTKEGECLVGEKPFFLSITVPKEGNYLVTVVAGDLAPNSSLCLKAELRRTLVEKRETAKGRLETLRFVVNTRTPRIPEGPGMVSGEVKLKAPRETTKEAWAWDSAITLEFNGSRPALKSVRVEPISVPTVYLIGDSTVCDQSGEPYASWGQMLTAFFGPGVAIANHAESGETLKDSIGRRRLDKIASLLRPGDFLFIQFGHNDQKQIAKNGGGAFTTYLAELKQHIAVAKAHGATPVVVSSMERRQFDKQGKIGPSLIEFAQAARKAAEDEKVPFIDLNALSKQVYEAVEARGKDASLSLFAPGDSTHHSNYGAYELANCIVQTLREQKSPLVAYLKKRVPVFDPTKPDEEKDLQLVASPGFTNMRPLGDTTN